MLIRNETNKQREVVAPAGKVTFNGLTVNKSQKNIM